MKRQTSVSFGSSCSKSCLSTFVWFAPVPKLLLKAPYVLVMPLTSMVEFAVCITVEKGYTAVLLDLSPFVLSVAWDFVSVVARSLGPIRLVSDPPKSVVAWQSLTSRCKFKISFLSF